MRNKRSVEASGLLRVSLETKFAQRRVDEYPGKASSPSVRGKKDIARERVVKLLTMSDLAGKHLHNTDSTFLSQSKNGEGNHDLFQFKADNQANLCHQSQRLGRGDPRGDWRSEQREVLAIGSQREEAEPTVDGTDQWSGYGGGRMICMEDVGSSAQGAKGARSKGELAHHKGLLMSKPPLKSSTKATMKELSMGVLEHTLIRS